MIRYSANVSILEPGDDVAARELEHLRDYMRRAIGAGHFVNREDCRRWWPRAAAGAGLAARAAERHGDGRT